MTSVNQEIKEIFELKAQVSSIQAEAQRVAMQAEEKMQQLRDRIRSGEKTTENRIKDFVIVCYGSPSEEIEAIYHDLEARVRQHVGEFILVVVKKENFHGCTGFGHEPDTSDYVVDKYHYLGVLKDGILALNCAKCEFSTGNHTLWWDAWRENVELAEGNIPWYSLKDISSDLNKPLKRKNPIARFQKESDLKLEVKIGDAEVKEWFGKQKGRSYLIVFHKAAQLLGRPMPESPELAAERERRRGVVIQRLTTLIQERNQLKQEIARIFGAVKGGAYSPDGVGISVCEDEDDACVISMGPCQKLKEVENAIKRQLKIALELSMADTQLLSIQQLC